MAYYPTYSHGGPSFSGWSAVVGNTTNSGRPISLVGALQTTAMFFIVTGTSGSLTAVLECNGGPLDQTFNPPANDWITTWTGVFDYGNKTGKKIQMTAPFWRTRITARSGDCVLVSYCGVGKAGSGGSVIFMPSYPQRLVETTTIQGI
jgi:hypothetical protein